MEYIYMIVKEYNPVHQLSKEDFDTVKSAGEEFGVKLSDDQALSLLDSQLYHEIRLHGASDTEVRDKLYTRFIRQVMGSYNTGRLHNDYAGYHKEIEAKVRSMGYDLISGT